MLEVERDNKKVAWKRSGKISVTFENSPPRKFALKVFGMFLESHSGNAGMFMIPIFQACPQRPLNTLQIFPNSMIKKKERFFLWPPQTLHFYLHLAANKHSAVPRHLFFHR